MKTFITITITLTLTIISSLFTPAFSEGILLPEYRDSCASVAEGNSEEAKIKRGECIFETVTFSGNGRTCASCHPKNNNFTIDPKFIANLKDNDPLFVHENNPELRLLENRDLLRKFALISANTDGFPTIPGGNDPAPATPRASSSLYGLRTSTTSNQSELVAAGVVHALGWDGKGSPGSTLTLDDAFVGTCSSTGTQCQGSTKTEADNACNFEQTIQTCEGFSADGSLKAFAIGAVRQHFTQTMNRELGLDFRFPTNSELDDLEAFQLSLGRQVDPDRAELLAMNFNSGLVRQGRDLFLGVIPTENGGSAGCNACHFNATANSSFAGNTNRLFDTGSEMLPNAPHVLEGTVSGDPDFGVDGGFGNAPLATGGFGNGKFNAVHLIEAADTPPFMHNHSINTIEEAVAFYNSDAFNSTARTPVHMETTEVNAIASWLRTINVLMNIDLSIDFLDKALASSNKKDFNKLVKSARYETKDAFQVLQDSNYNLFPGAIKLLKKAHKIEKFALRNKPNKVKKAKDILVDVKRLIFLP